MTYWGDHDRVEKIKRMLKDVRRDLGIIERILGYMGTKVPDVTRSRAVGPIGDDARLNWGVSGEGDE